MREFFFIPEWPDEDHWEKKIRECVNNVIFSPRSEKIKQLRYLVDHLPRSEQIKHQRALKSLLKICGLPILKEEK